MAGPEQPRNPKPAPPPPTIDNARLAAQENDTIRKRNGRSSTVLTSMAARQTGGVATRMLLGQGQPA